MNKKILWGAVLLINLFLFTFSSCSDDDDNSLSKPVIDLKEVGLENSKTAVAGSDLHLEGNITAEGLIKSIYIEIHQESGGSFKIEKTYADGKYIGIREASFHEHIDIPSEAPAGEYHLHFTVTDQTGQSTTTEAELSIEAAPANIIITGLGFGAGHDFPDNKIGYIGTAPVIEATSITAEAGIDRIYVKMHSEDPTPAFELDTTYTYNGEPSIENLHKHILIPDNAPAGEYHVHFKVYDKNGKAVEKSFGINIKATGIAISGIQIGTANEAAASDILTKLNITATDPLKSVRIRIYKADAPATFFFNDTITADFASGDVKNYSLDRHIAAIDNPAVGEYVLEIRVNDSKGAYKTIKEKLTITGA